MGRILVTPRSVTKNGHPALDRLPAAGHEVVLGPPGRQPTEDELVRLVCDCQGYLAGVEPVTSRVLQSAPLLRVISRNGTGIDNVDLRAAEARGIAVLRADGANARGVAELTIGLMFALARNLPASDARMKAGAWEREIGVELEGRTLGVVGCGRIGKLVAQRALGIGMQVIAHDAYPDKTFSPGTGFRIAAFDEVLARADFLSLHCPPAADASPLLDGPALSRMKRGAFIINSARHQLIEIEALLAALEEGRIAGVALDVFDAEPPRDPRLACHPRVVATPHIGGFTIESVGRAMDAAVDNLVRELAQVR